VAAAALAREAAKQFDVQLIERHVQSVEALRTALAAIKPREADAYFYISDAMVNSHARLVIDMTKSKKLPAMFSEQNPVVLGGLASYGQNFHETGRLSAKHVQKLMTGAAPAELRVETVDKFELIINLKTAKEIGVTIPLDVLARADRVIR
jgi:putative ABC transport system substrate-binding protein